MEIKHWADKANGIHLNFVRKPHLTPACCLDGSCRVFVAKDWRGLDPRENLALIDSLMGCRTHTRHLIEQLKYPKIKNWLC